jgi:hypothetical protein
MSIKFKRLRDQLEIPEYECVGLLSLLWLICSREAPDGGIGKLSDDDLGYLLGWTRSTGAELVTVLVERGWLDRDPVYRLVCHDWSEHCEDSIDARLARSGQVYADGAMPRMKKVSRNEHAVVWERCTEAQHEWQRLHDEAARQPTATSGGERQPESASGDQRQPAAASGDQRQPESADVAESSADCASRPPTVPFPSRSKAVPFRSREAPARVRQAGGSRAPGAGGAVATGETNTTQQSPECEQHIGIAVKGLVAETLAKSNTTQRSASLDNAAPGAREPPAWRTRAGQEAIVRGIIELTRDAKSERNWEIVVATLCQSEAGYESLAGSITSLKNRAPRDWPANPGAELNKSLWNYIRQLGLKRVRIYGETHG